MEVIAVPLLIPVKYRRFSYPDGIQPQLQEIAAHFDKESISPSMPLSLHTEYSHGKRGWDSPLFQDLPEICRAKSAVGIPKLWVSREWALEFAVFLSRLCGNRIPQVIEIHPPFADYSDWPHFFTVYRSFEEKILTQWPDVCLLIENRCGTLYKSPFLLSKPADFLRLAEGLEKERLRLRITWDIPQLFSALKSGSAKMLPSMDAVADALPFIDGIHLWGKSGPHRQPHYGDLNTYFRGDPDVKAAFLARLYDLLADGRPRFFVPEVNSRQEDLDSIVRDLLQAGFRFATQSL